MGFFYCQNNLYDIIKLIEGEFMREKVLIGSIITILIALCGLFSIFNTSDDFSCDYCYKRNEKIMNLSNNIYMLLTDSGKKELPDFYGGDYISNDGNHLVIQIVKDKIPSKKVNMSKQEREEENLYQKIIKYDKVIILEFVEYSYVELNTINDYLKKFQKDEYAKYMTTHYVDIKINRVVVGLKENTKENQERFKQEIMESSAIEFKTINHENAV